MPVLDHIDLIGGLVTGYKTPGAPDYAGEWPRNLNWLRADGTTADLSVVPDAAKNVSAAIIKTFNGSGATAWTTVTSFVDGSTFLAMTFRIPAVTASQYVRLRGTNLPAAVPFETDASGNPLADVYTNASDPTRLTHPVHHAPQRRAASSTAARTTWRRRPAPARSRARRPSRSTSPPGRTSGSTATRSTSRSTARRRSRASSKTERRRQTVTILSAPRGHARRRFCYLCPRIMSAPQLEARPLPDPRPPEPAAASGPGGLRLRGWLREPLLHFIVVGGLLFAVDHS